MFNCLYNGRTYRPGERWSLDPCTSCECDGGIDRCIAYTCSPLTCPPGEAPQRLPGECCQRCRAVSSECLSSNFCLQLMPHFYVKKVNVCLQLWCAALSFYLHTTFIAQLKNSLTFFLLFLCGLFGCSCDYFLNFFRSVPRPTRPAKCQGLQCGVPYCGEGVSPVLKEGECCPGCPGKRTVRFLHNVVRSRTWTVQKWSSAIQLIFNGSFRIVSKSWSGSSFCVTS